MGDSSLPAKVHSTTSSFGGRTSASRTPYRLLREPRLTPNPFPLTATGKDPTMNRSQLWAILIGVFVVAVLLFIFLRTGGPEEVQDLDDPGASAIEQAAPSTVEEDAGATSAEPAAE